MLSLCIKQGESEERGEAKEGGENTIIFFFVCGFIRYVAIYWIQRKGPGKWNTKWGRTTTTKKNKIKMAIGRMVCYTWAWGKKIVFLCLGWLAAQTTSSTKKKRDRESRFCDTPSLFQRGKNRIMSNRNDMWGHAIGPTTYIIWRQLQLRNVGEEGKRERRRGRKMQSKAKKSRAKGADDVVKTAGPGMLVCYCWTQQTKVKGSWMIMLRWSDGCAWFVSYLNSSYSTLVIDRPLYTYVQY